MTVLGAEIPSGRPSTSRAIGPANPPSRSASTFSLAVPPRAEGKGVGGDAETEIGRGMLLRRGAGTPRRDRRASEIDRERAPCSGRSAGAWNVRAGSPPRAAVPSARASSLPSASVRVSRPSRREPSRAARRSSTYVRPCSSVTAQTSTSPGTVDPAVADAGDCEERGLRRVVVGLGLDLAGEVVELDDRRRPRRERHDGGLGAAARSCPMGVSGPRLPRGCRGPRRRSSPACRAGRPGGRPARCSGPSSA